MLKKRRPTIKLLGSLISLGLSSGFLYAASERVMSVCYVAGVLMGIITVIGFLSLLVQTPETVAFVMKAREHNWLIYASMIATIQALLVLGWLVLACAYGLLICAGFVWRVIGTMRINKMSSGEFAEFESRTIAAMNDRTMPKA